MRHRWTVAAAAVAVLAGAEIVQAAQGWQVSPTPNQGTYDGLQAVSALSARDVWAVGRTAGAGTSNATLVEHFDGSSWRLVASPGLGTFASLLGVSALSTTDVWAVGLTENSGAPMRTLAEHWNGSAWSVVPTVDPKPASSLAAVLALSPTDVWAVGNATKMTSGQHGAPLVEHYDGHAWSNVKLPKARGSLTAITQTPSGLWAVGTDGLVLHRDASGWHGVPTPALAGAKTWELLSVTATPAGDLWAVGAADRPQQRGAFPLIEHYDGTSWSIVASPTTFFDSNLEGVAALAADDVWAVGQARTPPTWQPLLMHWDGARWTQVQGDPATPASSRLFALSTAGARQLWAVGDTFVGSTGDATLAERYK